MNAKQLQYAPDSFAKQFATLSPFSGKVVSLSDIDDPFYKNGLMGPGAAISSNSNTVISPFAGKVINISPLDYAIDIQSSAGLKCKIKYGGDTTHLLGAQFVSSLKRGEQIKPKQVLFTVNAAWLKQRGVSNTCALTILNAQALIGVLRTHQKFVEAGEDTLLTLYL
ncbi:PTS glucose transporter subunit IIA [Alteromonas sp. BL110]|uniref:PTS sugar transporter subunit IIA n=1 Tax=Alteromonas sp. BL110 TaxID=1714845 RepID=UPI000E50BCAD|nr:PTS glucose transporter subunit IIA [Alteromonas sp. BL110]AXT37284.1 PTS glucose transporter subunit IIA [Alteromonas sp. BL110]RKM80022.1 PTS glucose transporter subunit IIA [Alteromonas sp. BL110]